MTRTEQYLSSLNAIYCNAMVTIYSIEGAEHAFEVRVQRPNAMGVRKVVTEVHPADKHVAAMRICNQLIGSLR
jgi:hypothetical protein